MRQAAPAPRAGSAKEDWAGRTPSRLSSYTSSPKRCACRVQTTDTRGVRRDDGAEFREATTVWVVHVDRAGEPEGGYGPGNCSGPCQA